jgi:hypothetical protein
MLQVEDKVSVGKSCECILAIFVCLYPEIRHKSTIAAFGNSAGFCDEAVSALPNLPSQYFNFVSLWTGGTEDYYDVKIKLIDN